LAISQTKTAIAHAISYPLTYRYLVPHGLACSFTIPAIYSFLKNNYGLSEELDKVLKKAAVFVQNLGLQENLREYLSPEDFYQLSSEMTNPERFRNFVHDINPVQLRSIMRDAFVDKNL